MLLEQGVVQLDALVAAVDGVPTSTSNDGDDDVHGPRLGTTVGADDVEGDLDAEKPIDRPMTKAEQVKLREDIYAARKLAENGDAAAKDDLKKLRAVEHQLDPRRGTRAKRVQNRV